VTLIDNGRAVDFLVKVLFAVDFDGLFPRRRMTSTPFPFGEQERKIEEVEVPFCEM
jgi:hypothetical protein